MPEQIVEYRVRPVTRYIVTRYHELREPDLSAAGSEVIGEFQNERLAQVVRTALDSDIGDEAFAKSPESEESLADSTSGEKSPLERAVDEVSAAFAIGFHRCAVNSKLNGEQPLFAHIGYEDIRSLERKLVRILRVAMAPSEQFAATLYLMRETIWGDWCNSIDRPAEDGPCGIPPLEE